MDASTHETTQPERDAKSGRFLAGNSGFGGRPKGSRNKFGEAFIEDIYKAWTKSGRDVIERVVRDEPATFLKVAAGLLPREVELNASPELAEMLASARDFAQAFRFALDAIGSEHDAEVVPMIEAEAEEIVPESSQNGVTDAD